MTPEAQRPVAVNCMADINTERRLAAIEARCEQCQDRWEEVRTSLAEMRAKLDTMSTEWAAAKIGGRWLLAVGAVGGGIAGVIVKFLVDHFSQKHL